jgi:putative membrane protein
MLLNSIRGFFMAIADSIPGISGGTIAYLLGFYDLFIGSISDFIHGNKEKRSKAFIFIIQLLFFCFSYLFFFFLSAIARKNGFSLEY